MALRVLYVNPLALGGNPAIDAIAYGLQHLPACGGDRTPGALCRLHRPGLPPSV